ncbi:hypothetical protein CASFOL_020950 [Castilleja foliolosa]|uniref:Uncharacterized protein n=1 Tax=Castilleja foliolosa TaxID=1961234 RepID=A0ABD3D2A8_9LAMI
MGTEQGYSYAGKRSLRCLEKDETALIEVEVVYKEKSTHFLISRETLYMLDS